MLLQAIHNPAGAVGGGIVLLVMYTKIRFCKQFTTAFSAISVAIPVYIPV